ncbi:hypothetical protein [Variovorax sp. IB41]|uniref:hypothetical protein n=1 Tax=Variovorax sp. IB41 TaxID=2779370 RepID=UPI0018E8F04D|nr:hypothetical protein [Variovorax sp. IB41]MBJ2158607.1 hypothetical protein [Variovorax sp. IB41]
MNNPSNPHFALRGIAVFSIAAGLALSAAAQSTGNPKGSVAPPTSDAQKAPASRSPTGGFGDSGKIVTDKETVQSRSQTMTPPANAGPAQPAPDKSPGRANSGPSAKGAGTTTKPAPQ